MKIERISDNQVKIILNRIDLDARNIKLTELAYGSEKAQELFRDIMERAQAECGFESENLPLMIEAIPYSQDSITIIVTRVQNQSEFEERFKIMSKGSGQQALNSEHSKEDEASPASSTSVFSFNSIDDAAIVAAKIVASKIALDSSEDDEPDMFFKMGGLFYFVLADAKAKHLETHAREFGQQHSSSSLSKYYLMEHGELLIKEHATNKLARYLI